MIQPETDAKSTDTVRKWESSNLKGASSCQMLGVPKSRALERESWNEGTCPGGYSNPIIQEAEAGELR